MEFTVEETFNVSAKRLFTAWLDSDEHTEMTGGDALITDEPEDKYTAWDGYIWGENITLTPFSYIKQSWKTSDFEDGQAYSLIEIKLESISENRTRLILKHSGLTDEDEHYKQGWVDSYFKPMKAYFGG